MTVRMTDEDFIRKRITELRIRKGVSEYKMSLDLGHSKGYIQSISSGRTNPSVSELLYICDYLGVSVRDFFDDGQQYPEIVAEIIDSLGSLEQSDLEMIKLLARRLGSG